MVRTMWARVAGVDGRGRERPADRVEQRLVPAPGDGPLRVVRDRRARRLLHPRPGDDQPDHERADHGEPGERRRIHVGIRDGSVRLDERGELTGGTGLCQQRGRLNPGGARHRHHDATDLCHPNGQVSHVLGRHPPHERRHVATGHRLSRAFFQLGFTGDQVETPVALAAVEIG